MIRRFYLQDYLSFKEIECNFSNGLIVFSGPSGAGKSILMNSILSLFGHGVSKAKISEVTLDSINIENEDYLIKQNDEFVIKQNTSSKTRYFLNSQSISKKDLSSFTNNFSRHLHLKDTSDFNSNKLISFLDNICEKHDLEFKILKDDFICTYEQLSIMKKDLSKINNDEKDLDDLIDFIKFEINKIETLSPKDGELEELKEFKTKLSKKEKIDKLVENAKPTLDNLYTISQLLNELDINSGPFDDVTNDIINHIENYNDSFDNICDDEIDHILTRIEDLSKLEKKYGSINEALEYKKEQELELEKYDNITFEKAILEKNILKLSKASKLLSSKLTTIRTKYIPQLIKSINTYLKLLYLDGLSVKITEIDIDKNGSDYLEFYLNDTSLNDISSGEFNRLRLALLTARSQIELNTNGILFLDEIDANLSGKESESIAKVLKELSKSYQIFAISHQPQLSATATQHYLVYKDQHQQSSIKQLSNDERISEISRMISGEDISLEAEEFAKKLLKKENIL
jgi:DNA repair protein RecN (Recombination protein N)